MLDRSLHPLVGGLGTCCCSTPDPLPCTRPEILQSFFDGGSTWSGSFPSENSSSSSRITLGAGKLARALDVTRYHCHFSSSQLCHLQASPSALPGQGFKRRVGTVLRRKRLPAQASPGPPSASVDLYSLQNGVQAMTATGLPATTDSNKQNFNLHERWQSDSPTLLSMRRGE